MKKLIFTLATLACTMALHAQDIITKTDGSDIQAKILEVNQDEIKYKRYDNPDGPTFTMSKYEILMIRYENGTNEVFNHQQQPAPVTYRQQPKSQAAAYPQYTMDYGTAGKVYPGMKYRHYKKFYDPSMWISQPGDKYSPVAGGICSWIIPGLGQMICGEVGRGFGYFLGAGAFSSMMSCGLIFMYDAPILGICLATAGSVGLLTIDICSIVDGVRVAKIKNMYNQDMRNLSMIDVHLTPYVSTINTATVRTPVVGATLGISF